MTSLPEDRELLAAFREGEREALERVYKHYVMEIAAYLKHGFTYTSGGTPRVFAGFRAPSELDAAVQEVFIRAFEPQTRMAYDGLRAYGGFLIGIARNVAFKEVERAAVRDRRTEPLEETTAEIAALGPEIEDTLDARRARELVARFLTEQCDDRDRKLFRLRYDEGLAQEQAAREVGASRIQLRRWEKKFHTRLIRFLRREKYLDEPPPRGES